MEDIEKQKQKLYEQVISSENGFSKGVVMMVVPIIEKINPIIESLLIAKIQHEARKLNEKNKIFLLRIGVDGAQKIVDELVEELKSKILK